MTNVNEKIMCAGFGGQGVLALGQIISLLAMYNDLNVSWIPSYGAEMRGGTANCSIIYSDRLVGSPILTNDITTLIAMNNPSLDKFEDRVVKDGLIIVNSSIVTRKVKRKDLQVVYIDATDIATELGNIRVQNMLLLGSYIGCKSDFTMKQVERAFKEKFKESKAAFIPMNTEAFKKGMALVKEI